MAQQKETNEQERVTRQILRLGDDIFRMLRISLPREWLSSELTLAQIRVLLVLYTGGQQRMGNIAETIGISTSTASGVVDNLVKKGLVLRESDTEDRRLVICRLSSQGEEQVKRLWALGRFQIKRLLHGLTLPQLRQAAGVASFLLANVQEDIRGGETPHPEDEG
jgi:DNA-binding MarR family transcriptional regulator